MLSLTKSILIIISIAFVSLNCLGQTANPAPVTTTIKTVQVTASVKEAEVGQAVKVTAIAMDAAGNVVKEQPSAYFAGPFDIAAVDDNGNVKLFGTGQVTVGAIVGGVPARTTFMVKPPSIKSIELKALKSP